MNGKKLPSRSAWPFPLYRHQCFINARPAKVSALLEDLVKLALARKARERYIV